MAGGIVPDKPVLFAWKYKQFVNTPILLGIVPLNKLPPISSARIIDRRESDDGIVPDRLFPYRYRAVNAVKDPICEGIDPVKEFVHRSRQVKLVNNPMAVGMAPVKLNLGI